MGDEAWMDLFDADSSEEGCEEPNPDDSKSLAEPKMQVDRLPQM